MRAVAEAEEREGDFASLLDDAGVTVDADFVFTGFAFSLLLAEIAASRAGVASTLTTSDGVFSIITFSTKAGAPLIGAGVVGGEVGRY